MHETLPRLLPTDFPSITRQQLTGLQVNLGYRCNQRCLHCHVNAGPTRTEMMNAEGITLLLAVVDKHDLTCVDLTGGAPELNLNFRPLVTALRERGVTVIDRCNLTILSEPGQEDLADFFAEHQVEVCASLPCYTADNVDRQRGDGVFERSIDGLQKLNALGYGKRESGLVLNLVYNPSGPTLPPQQDKLQADYERELSELFEIEFNHLFVIANMPIQRFGSTLISQGKFERYIALLKSAHRQDNLGSVMCRKQLSVDWQGYLYDCDFNQMLNLSANFLKAQRPHLKDLLNETGEGRCIVTAEHCYGCTAGQGSSCSGSLDSSITQLIATDVVL